MKLTQIIFVCRLPAGSYSGSAVFLFLFCCFLAMPERAFAQNHLGLSAGADLYEQVDFRVALMVEIQDNDWLSWQAEFVYIKRENLDIIQLLPAERDFIRPVISYFYLPILMKAKLEIPGANMYALLGPKIGRAAAVYSTLVSEDKSVVNETFELNELGLGQWDFGLSLGIGLEKEITRNKKIFIEFRYYLGLTDINQLTEDSIYNEGKSFNLGFFLPISQ